MLRKWMRLFSVDPNNIILGELVYNIKGMIFQKITFTAVWLLEVSGSVRVGISYSEQVGVLQ